MIKDVMFDGVILTDCDGVLTFWERAFAMWMHDNGYRAKNAGHYEIHLKYGIPEDQAFLLMTMFNESSRMASLPPMRDAIKYVRKLHEDHGYVFHCISAIPDLSSTLKLRWENLRNMFGVTAFERVVLCGSDSGNKDRLLEYYEGSECFWIEDLPKNAEYGLKYGLKPLLVKQHYNEHYNNPRIPKVTTWKEIYEYIVGNELHPA